MQTGRRGFFRRGLIAAAILTFASLTHAADIKPFVIDDDHGGTVDTFARWYKRLADSGMPVIVRGVCESACTLVLSLPRSQVCIEPTASFGFHHATIDDRPEPGVTRAISRRFYPQAVLDWLVGKTLRDVPIYMSAATVVKLGIFPACDAPAVALVEPVASPPED